MKVASRVLLFMGSVLFLCTLPGVVVAKDRVAETSAAGAVKAKPFFVGEYGFYAFDGSFYLAPSVETCIPELVKKAEALGDYTRVTVESVGFKNSHQTSRESYYDWNLQGLSLAGQCEMSTGFLLYEVGSEKLRRISPSRLLYYFESKSDCEYKVPRVEIKVDPPASGPGFTLSKNFSLAHKLSTSEKNKITKLIKALKSDYSTLSSPVFLENRKFPKSVFVVMTEGDSASDKYLLFETTKEKAKLVDQDFIETCGS